MLPEFKKSKEYKRYKFMQINNSGIFDININLLSLNFNLKNYDMLMCCAELNQDVSRYSKIQIKIQQ